MDCVKGARGCAAMFCEHLVRIASHFQSVALVVEVWTSMHGKGALYCTGRPVEFLVEEVQWDTADKFSTQHWATIHAQ